MGVIEWLGRQGGREWNGLLCLWHLGDGAPRRRVGVRGKDESGVGADYQAACERTRSGEENPSKQKTLLLTV
jgi:hypothetical protein